MNARHIRPRVERSRVEQHPQQWDAVTETVLEESIMPLVEETPAFSGPAVASLRQRFSRRVLLREHRCRFREPNTANHQRMTQI